jgi:Trypsin-like peptidase domain
MVQQLEQCVIRILNTKGEVVGAGFVVANRLAVTCAHVVEAAGGSKGQSISFQFCDDAAEHTAQVLVEGWSPSDIGEDTNDVAFLLLQSLPKEVVPVVLGTAMGRNRHKYTALGFSSLAVYEYRWADGYLSGVVPVLGKRPTLQFEGGKIKEGMSGAPILDLDTNRVVGMVCVNIRMMLGSVSLGLLLLIRYKSLTLHSNYGLMTYMLISPISLMPIET